MTKKIKKIVVPLAIPADLQDEINGVAEKAQDFSKQDIMRQSIRKGLPLVAEMFGLTKKKAA